MYSRIHLVSSRTFAIEILACSNFFHFVGLLFLSPFFHSGRLSDQSKNSGSRSISRRRAPSPPGRFEYRGVGSINYRQIFLVRVQLRRVTGTAGEDRQFLEKRREYSRSRLLDFQFIWIPSVSLRFSILDISHLPPALLLLLLPRPLFFSSFYFCRSTGIPSRSTT